MKNIHYVFINILMILAIAILFFAATVFWLPWWLALLFACGVLVTTLHSNWQHMTVTVPNDTAYAYNFTLGRNRGGLKQYVMMWPGLNGVLLWFHKLETTVSFKRDFTVTAPFHGNTYDGAEIVGEFKINLKIDPANTLPWIRTGDTDEIREEEVKSNCASYLDQVASSICRTLSRDTLLLGTVIYTGTTTEVTGIDYFTQSVIAHFSRRNQFEADFGVQVKSVTPGRLKATDEISKSMQQRMVNYDLTLAAQDIVNGSGGTINMDEARRMVLLIADEVTGFDLHVGGNPEIAAALTRIAQNINPAILGAAGGGTGNQNPGNRGNRNGGRRRGRRGNGGRGPI